MGQTATPLLNAKQQKLAYYLAQGVKPAQAASICGVTPGYVAQLLSQMKQDAEQGLPNALAEAITAHRDASQEEFSESEQLNVRYLSVEHKALDAIESNLSNGSLREQIQALQVIADIQDKKRKASAPPPASGPGMTQYNITQITLPAHALRVPQVQMDSQMRIISIDEQPMAAMTGDQVRQLFATKRGQPMVVSQEGASGVVIDSQAAPADF